MIITRTKVIFAIVCGLLAGCVFFVQAVDWFAVRNAPVVSGRVMSRTPTSWLSIPRVDFTIRINGSDTTVHARTQRGMMNKVPDIVRFHYTGDPNRNVFLFDQEANPGWLVLMFWGGALLLLLMMRSGYVCETLGWSRKAAEERMK
jgi:hypothetical protein